MPAIAAPARIASKIERQIDRVIEAVKAGMRSSSMVGISIPPFAQIYRRKVADLAGALNAEEAGVEAAEILRTLIEKIRLIPAQGKQLEIELDGALLALRRWQKNAPAVNYGGAINNGCGDTKPPIPNILSLCSSARLEAGNPHEAAAAIVD